MSDFFSTGCILDPKETDATISDLIRAGKKPVFGDNDNLRGEWRRLKARGVLMVMLSDVWKKYYPDRRADFQNGSKSASPAPDEGTCVARGTYRAATTSYLIALNQNHLVGKPQILSFEAIYGIMRVTVGKGRIRGGGAIGAWGGKAMSLYGAPSRDDLGFTDTPIGRTDLASLWGRNGVPADVLQKAASHTFDSHFAANVDEQMDCIAAKYAGAFCRGFTGGTRDKYGMSRLNQPSNHCETVMGVFVAHNGEDGILMQQSWGKSPDGPGTLILKGGAEYQLPEGCYGVFASDQQRVFRGGAESWHFEPREGSQWR